MVACIIALIVYLPINFMKFNFVFTTFIMLYVNIYIMTCSPPRLFVRAATIRGTRVP